VLNYATGEQLLVSKIHMISSLLYILLSLRLDFFYSVGTISHRMFSQIYYQNSVSKWLWCIAKTTMLIENQRLKTRCKKILHSAAHPRKGWGK